MARILEFKSAPRPTAASMLSACAAAESAEIVMFPGVRYERSSDDSSSRPPQASRHLEESEFEN